ncbi:MAG: hypothetical protein WBB45_01215 [Cyclobacteriaceae bacterium]
MTKDTSIHNRPMKAVKFLLKASPLQAEQTIQKLELTGERAIPVMEAILKEGSCHLRLSAVRCLARLDYEASTYLLKGALNDPIDKVAEEACAALRARNLCPADSEAVAGRWTLLQTDKNRKQEAVRQHEHFRQQKEETVRTRFRKGLERHSDLAVHHIGYYQRRRALRFGMIETGILALFSGALLLLLSFTGSFSLLTYADLFFQAMGVFCLGSGTYQIVRANMVR